MRLRPISESFRMQMVLLNWVRIIVFAVGCTIFALPLSWPGNMYPWSSWPTIVPLVLGFLILVAFAIFESRPQSPVFPCSIFRSRTAQTALIGSFSHCLTLYTLLCTCICCIVHTSRDPTMVDELPDHRRYWHRDVVHCTAHPHAGQRPSRRGSRAHNRHPRFLPSIR